MKFGKKIVKKIISGICIILIIVMIWQTKSRFAFLGIGFWFLFLSSNWIWNWFLKFVIFTKNWYNLEGNLQQDLRHKSKQKLSQKTKEDENNKFEKIDKNKKKKNILSDLFGIFGLKKEFQEYIWYFWFLRKTWFFLIMILPIFIGVVAINLPIEILNKFPVAIAKPSSTFWHGMRTGATLELIQKNPTKWFLGFGLGASGPAAKLEYYDIKKAEIFAKNEQIAYSYRLVGEDLTIPENWFLQVFLNGGIIYFVLYLSILSLAIQPLQSFLFKPKSSKLGKTKTLDNLYLNISNLPNNLQISKSFLFKKQQKNKNETQTTRNEKLILQNSNTNSNSQQNQESEQNNLKITRSILVSLAFFGVLVGNLFLHIFEAQIIVLYWSLLYLWANLPIETK